MEVNVELNRFVIPVVEDSQIGEARRVASRLAADFNETQRGKIGIVATELATNLVRHAARGELHINRFFDDRTQSFVVEMIASDTGPGMPDVEQCMQDGFSTGGTAGQGLGAIRRLSSEFDVHSTPDVGTIVFARVAAAAAPPHARQNSGAVWGAVSIAAPGEPVCGDSWRAILTDDQLSIVVVDGLGHGVLAAEAAGIACNTFESNPTAPPDALLHSMHKALTGSRGAAAAIASINTRRNVLTYAGVGNIAGSLVAPDSSRGLLSHNGIVGSQMRKVQAFEYEWPAQGVLLMCSDGLQSRWNLQRYPGLIRKHPAVIAATLARDYKRGRDDLTVFVARLGTQEPGV